MKPRHGERLGDKWRGLDAPSMELAKLDGLPQLGPEAGDDRTEVSKEERMFTTLRKIAGATAVVPVRRDPRPNAGSASLRKAMPCRNCGLTLRLVRYVRLVPSGVRGYYSDHAGHIVAIDRSGVTRSIRSDSERIYFV